MSEHLETIGLNRQYSKLMRPCEITNSTDFVLFQEYGRVGEPGVYGQMPVYICKTSGFKMLNPRYEDRFYKDYYEELYRKVAFGSAKPSNDYIEQQKKRGAGVLSYVSKFVQKPGRMLDLGCASGATMLSWIESGWKCKGVDPHRASVDTAVNDMSLDVYVGAGESLPFDDDSFDLILCLGPHEHAYDLNRMFNETIRTLSDGGLLLIRWRSADIFGSPLEYYNHNHYRFFTHNNWRLILRRYGFSILEKTSEKLEGWQSYEYILARKDLSPSVEEVQKLIANGVKDDWSKELKKIQFIRKDYYERCREFLNLSNRLRGRENDIKNAVINGDVRWTFMTEVPNLSVPRSIMEAQRYVAEYESGNVR